MEVSDILIIITAFLIMLQTLNLSRNPALYFYIVEWCMPNSESKLQSILMDLVNFKIVCEISFLMPSMILHHVVW
jgi:hypothetical protein